MYLVMSGMVLQNWQIVAPKHRKTVYAELWWRMEKSWWGQWYKKIGYKKEKESFEFCMKKALEKEKLDVEKIRTSFPQSWKVIVLWKDGGSGDGGGMDEFQITLQSKQHWLGTLTSGCLDFLWGVRMRFQNNFQDARSYNWLPNLIKGPWRSSIFVVVGDWSWLWVLFGDPGDTYFRYL